MVSEAEKERIEPTSLSPMRVHMTVKYRKDL